MMSGGPIAWSSKRQKITARSSAEAEIYATDECTKNILHIQHIRQDLHFSNSHNSCPIYNDNAACVQWAHNCTSKGLRHIQIRENAVRESILTNRITVSHIAGNINLGDIFTKEDKDSSHFLELRSHLVREIPFTFCSTPCSPKQCST